MILRFLLTFVFFLLSVYAHARNSDEIDFRADFYERNNATNMVKGRGNAWLKQGGREIFADTIEVDLSTNRFVANGNVHMIDGELHAWASHVTYDMKNDTGILDNSTLISAQMVITGVQIQKLGPKSYDIRQGSYTNCNVELSKDPSSVNCAWDWKIDGSFFSMTFGEYAHVHDAIVSVKRLPVFYAPYFIYPLKTERQSGFLMPNFSSLSSIGSGFTIPFFWAIDKWHDLTILPSYLSNAGYRFGFNYRYVYSSTFLGNANFYFVQKRFSDSLSNPGVDDKNRKRTLGFIGEAAFNLDNRIGLWGRAQSRQLIQLVSNRYYTYEFGSDAGPDAGLGFLRNQVSFSLPTDQWSLTAFARYNHSLTISRDEGVDRGPVTILPAISVAKKNASLLASFIDYEVDFNFANYYRPIGFDDVPSIQFKTGTNRDDRTGYDANDYIRTGRRIQFEPRLIANIPMPDGFQLQPLIKAGTLLYHLDYPSSSLLSREYVETEVPLSLYLSRSFETGISGFEKISHVFQPRVIYASSPYQSEPSTHPFFYRESVGNFLSNPRFDITDQLTPFEYMRFELINRFRRKNSDGIQRFLLLQISEQFNLRTSQIDPRFSRRVGPIEMLMELSAWRFSGQLQAKFPLELTNTVNNAPIPSPVRETEISATLTYKSPTGDAVGSSILARNRADLNAREQWISVSGTKVLPTFFNIDGSILYNARKGRMQEYAIGFLFSAKPRSCWYLYLRTGRTSFDQNFASVSFNFNFGNPSGIAKSQ